MNVSVPAAAPPGHSDHGPRWRLSAEQGEARLRVEVGGRRWGAGTCVPLTGASMAVAPKAFICSRRDATCERGAMAREGGQGWRAKRGGLATRATLVLLSMSTAPA